MKRSTREGNMCHCGGGLLKGKSQSAIFTLGIYVMTSVALNFHLLGLLRPSPDPFNITQRVWIAARFLEVKEFVFEHSL